MKASRRSALKFLAATPFIASCVTASSRSVRPVSLLAGVTKQRLISEAYPETEVWAYGASVPGPTLRYKQGDTLRVELANHLPEDTTIHWHGVRVPNAMDGVPHMTQAPVLPGGRFVYEFPLPDAG